MLLIKQVEMGMLILKKNTPYRFIYTAIVINGMQGIVTSLGYHFPFPRPPQQRNNC